MKFLSDNQLSHFEVQSIKDDAWSQIKTELYILFKQNDNFRILDIGGGTGKFVDKILNEFPNSQAVIIDSSELLLSKNTEHPRKSTIMNSVENLAKVFENEKFDFISLNCVLHHFVDDSYTESTNNIANVLRTAKKTN